MTINIVMWCCYTVLNHARPHNDVSICLVNVQIELSALILSVSDDVLQYSNFFNTVNTIHYGAGYTKEGQWKR